MILKYDDKLYPHIVLKRKQKRAKDSVAGWINNER